MFFREKKPKFLIFPFLVHHMTAMLVIKVIIVILFASNFGHSFPVDNKKLPSTFEVKECPPGFLPCVSEKDDNVSSQVRGSTPSPTSPNTTSTVGTEAPTSTQSRSSNHSATGQQSTSKAPSGENVAETWDKKDSELQERHECPPGIWVC